MSELRREVSISILRLRLDMKDTPRVKTSALSRLGENLAAPTRGLFSFAKQDFG